jgi:hypothetical protein
MTLRLSFCARMGWPCALLAIRYAQEHTYEQCKHSNWMSSARNTAMHWYMYAQTLLAHTYRNEHLKLVDGTRLLKVCDF